MTEAAPAGDPTMTAITSAVTEAHNGHVDDARTRLLELWKTIRGGDPLHRCTLAHHLADMYTHPAQALIWDIRALDAADAITEQRAQEHHPGLRVESFYPSLHLNLADDLRRLGSFDGARQHLDDAQACISTLPADSYGDLIRSALGEVAIAVENHDTAPRTSAPQPSAP